MRHAIKLAFENKPGPFGLTVTVDGSAASTAAGTVDDPILIADCEGNMPRHFAFYDQRNTNNATSSRFNSYETTSEDYYRRGCNFNKQELCGNTEHANQRGKEFVYKFTINDVIKGNANHYSMCVSSVAETILVAMDIYAQETGDTSIWNHLPKSSWTSYGQLNIRDWINSSSPYGYGGVGASDGVSAFGMGMTVAFQDLAPGGTMSLNFVAGSGHSTIFLAFVDSQCNEYDTYNENVAGIKFFSSQNGGMGIRYAPLQGKSVSGCVTPEPFCRSTMSDPFYGEMNHQLWSNMAILAAPKYWVKTSYVAGVPSFE